MHRIVILVLGAVALAVLSAIAPVELNAQSTPDFSGVYYPVQQGRGGAGGAAAAAPPAGQRGTPPPPPTRSAPTGDLSNGRAPNAPSLTSEYLAKWEIIRKSRMSG